MQRLTRSWSGYSTAEWRLWLRWVAATAVGLALGFGVAGIATGAVAERPGVGNLLSVSWQLTMGLCLGAITSLVQYLILRPHVPRASWWMLCITLGAMLGAVVGAWVGMGVVMFTLGIVGGPCSAIIRQDLCFPATFYLGFVAAGGAAGMIAGTAIGVLLKMVDRRGPRSGSGLWQRRGLPAGPSSGPWRRPCWDSAWKAASWVPASP